MRRMVGLLSRLNRYADAEGLIRLLRREGVLVLEGRRQARPDAPAFAAALARCGAD
jgi:hypothetical protein